MERRRLEPVDDRGRRGRRRCATRRRTRPRTATPGRGGADGSEARRRAGDVSGGKQDAAGARLDVYVTARFARLSRTQVQRMIRDGHVSSTAARPSPATRSAASEEIWVEVPPPPVRELVPEYMPLDVLYEDDKMIVINKPAGIVVHPARGHWGGTLINGILYHCHNLSNIAPGRPGIVHRLDRDTTGVILFMKEDWSHRHVAQQFEIRRTQKEYLAVVEGEMEYDEDIISRPLGRHPTDSRRKWPCASRAGGSRRRQYKVLERFRGYTYVACMPKTGRTHQIRVHHRGGGTSVRGETSSTPGADRCTCRRSKGSRSMRATKCRSSRGRRSTHIASISSTRGGKRAIEFRRRCRRIWRGCWRC